LKNIPLLLLPVLMAHALLFGGGNADITWLAMTLPSGASFTLDAGTVILAVGLAALFVEVFKASLTTRSSLVDHMLSLALFVVLLLEFLLWPAAGTGLFVLLTLMALVDVVAGFAVGLAVARRDVGIIREG
jgi:predicted MFS family arabinose efflux permease